MRNMTEQPYYDNDSSQKSTKTTIFAVRTTIGQEKGVLNLLFNRLRVMNPFPDIKVMMISEQLRGYVFVEAIHQREIQALATGIPHVKGKVVGSIKLESISHVISPRRVTEVLEEGDEVEIISGLFQGQRATVVRMPREGAKEEVTLRLLQSDSAISIKIHGDFLKLTRKGEKHKDKYTFKEGEEVSADGSPLPPKVAATDARTPIVTIKGENIPAGKETGVYSFEDQAATPSEPKSVETPETPSETGEAPIEKAEKPKGKEKVKAKEKEEGEEEEDEWSKFSF
jgi:transcription elongation factor Spt5